MTKKKKDIESIAIKAEKKESKIDIKENLKKLLDSVKKEYSTKGKENSIFSGVETSQLRLKKIFFGISGLDRICGGYPVGKTIEIWGSHSTGKTSTCAMIIAESQKVCRFCNEYLEFDCKCKSPQRKRVVYVDSEDKYDPMWFSLLGVDIHCEDFVVVNPGMGAEQAGDIIADLSDSGEFDIFIIDTLANLTPSKEIEDGLENWNMGLAARIISKMLRVWTSMVQRVRLKFGITPTLFLINQKRASLAMYSSPDAKPVGLAQDFAPVLILKYRSRSILYSKNKSDGADGGEKTAVGIKTTIFFEKSKISKEGMEAEFKMYLNPERNDGFYSEFDNISQLLDEMLNKKFILENEDNKSINFSDSFKEKLVNKYDNKKFDFFSEYKNLKTLAESLRDNFVFYSICRKVSF